MAARRNSAARTRTACLAGSISDSKKGVRSRHVLRITIPWTTGATRTSATAVACRVCGCIASWTPRPEEGRCMFVPTEPAEDDFLPLSALNDLLFCPRRCALHRLEGLWVENVRTAEGSRAHRRAHGGGQDALEAAGQVVRSLWLRSTRLRLVGVADVVEFHPQPYPVEYKLKRRRRWDNDDVQLCAQALCLEEMLGTPVPAGAIFHVRSRRRREVAFDAALRQTTEDAVARLPALVRSGATPPPVLHPKCRQCSLHHLCLPELITDQARYRRAARDLFAVLPD